MSFSGKFTPLQLNVLSSFTGAPNHAANPTLGIPANTSGDPEGIDIAGATRNYAGSWSTSYTPGKVVNDTALKNLTLAIQTAYTNLGATPSQANVNIYRAMLQIGQSVCPALGNSRPDTFMPTYAGYGSWDDTTGNQLSGNYPPKNYPVVTKYSYVQQAAGKLAWIYSWPERPYTTGGQDQISSWQKSYDS